MLPFRGFIIPLLIIASLAFVSWVLLRFILKNGNKAGLIVSLFFFLLLFYGHIYNVLTSDGSEEFFLSKTDLLLIFLILLIGGISYFVITKRKLDNATFISNGISFTLLVMVLINIGSYNLETYSINSNAGVPQNMTLVSQFDQHPPDVYYILLDGYANKIILKEYFDYDNSKFVDFLTETGFYVPSGYTHSNYVSTKFSVPSVLSMNWVEKLVPENLPAQQLDQARYKIIDQNLVMQNFKSLGYEIFSFDSGWWGTRKIDIADHNLCENPNVDWRVLKQLKSTTMVSAIEIVDSKLDTEILNQKRHQIICEFSELKKIRDRIDGPIFVFAHFLAPHPPWVFESDGTPVKENISEFGDDLILKKQAYISQLEFVNFQVEKVIEILLSKSKSPPIIVIQSDHGTRIVSKEKFNDEDGKYIRVGNFNAFYVPGDAKDYFSEKINSVNTFRIIFNKFYNGTYDLLENKVIFYKNEIKNWEEIEASVVLKKLNGS